MVKISLHCPYCRSDRHVKNGRTEDGRQRYLRCACCRRHRAEMRSNRYTAAQRETILRAYQERSRLRGLMRMFGVARNTVSGWLKKGTTSDAYRSAIGYPGRCAPGKAWVLAIDFVFNFDL